MYDASGYKFTGKERDTETGLDYFGARYYGSNIGRFSSPDPLLGSAALINPQSWNRYSYVSNNPLAFVDPTGLFQWGANAGNDASDEDLEIWAKSKYKQVRNYAKNALAFRENFRAGVNAAAASASGRDSAAVPAYGRENEANGVYVQSQKGYGASTILQDNGDVNVAIGDSLKGNDIATVIAHEGEHVFDDKAWYSGTGPNYNHFLRETLAWYVSSRIAQALGMKSYHPHGGSSDYDVWNKGWKAPDVETMRSHGVQNIINFMGLQPTTKIHIQLNIRQSHRLHRIAEEK